MSPARRINLPNDCPYKRGDEIQFQFEGGSIEGYRHEPLAIALLAAGVRVFGRSIKYHRPRGATCLQAHCSGCLMRVDGVPNVRTCDTPCRSGQVVERQIGWPGSGRDLFRLMDWIYGQRLDHHGMFTSSGTLNRMAMRFVRKMAGFGDPPTADIPRINLLERGEAEVVVIGAGTAGLAASMALAEAGHPVILFEHGDKIGGRLLGRACRIPTDDDRKRSGWEVRQEIKSRFEKLHGIELHQCTPVVAVYPGPDGPCVVASNDRETISIDARRLIVTCGAWDQVPLFEDNDLPGIFTLRGLDRLVCGWGVVPAEPILVAGESDEALQLALQLSLASVELAGVLTERREGELVDVLSKAGVDLIHGHRILRARGGRWLDRVELATASSTEPDLVLDCGMLAVEAPESPAYELAHHAGCRVEFRSASGYVVVTDENGRTSDVRVFAAGHCAGARDTAEAMAQGVRAGLACASKLEGTWRRPSSATAKT